MTKINPHKLQFLIVVIISSLSACSMGPDFKKPQIEKPLSFTREGASAQNKQPNPLSDVTDVTNARSPLPHPYYRCQCTIVY